MTTTRQRWFTRHPRLTLAAVAISGCFGVLVIGEFAARFMHPAWMPITLGTSFFQYDESLGWSHIPGAQGAFAQQDFCINISISSQGFRDVEHSPAKTRKRLLVVGDSYAWGFCVEQSERFSDLLAKDYPAWEVINAAVSGYSTVQEYLSVKELLPTYQPDVVLLVFCRNDFANNVRGEEYFRFKPYFANGEIVNVPVPRDGTWQQINRFAAGSSYLANWATHTLAGNVAVDRDGSEQATSAVLLQIQTLCKLSGAVFVVVADRMKDWERESLLTIATSHGIPCITMDEAFVRSARPVRFPHDLHWNAAGHSVVAGAVEEWLAELGILSALDYN